MAPSRPLRAAALLLLLAGLAQGKVVIERAVRKVRLPSRSLCSALRSWRAASQLPPIGFSAADRHFHIHGEGAVSPGAAERWGRGQGLCGALRAQQPVGTCRAARGEVAYAMRLGAAPRWWWRAADTAAVLPNWLAAQLAFAWPFTVVHISPVCTHRHAKRSTHGFAYTFPLPTRLLPPSPPQVALEGGSAKLPWTPVTAPSFWPSDISCREFALPAPLAAGAKTTLLAVAVYTHVLRPEPAEVKQRAVQRVVFHGGAQLMSPYKVESQATEVRLAGCGCDDRQSACVASLTLWPAALRVGLGTRAWLRAAACSRRGRQACSCLCCRIKRLFHLAERPGSRLAVQACSSAGLQQHGRPEGSHSIAVPVPASQRARQHAPATAGPPGARFRGTHLHRRAAGEAQHRHHHLRPLLRHPAFYL